MIMEIMEILEGLELVEVMDAEPLVDQMRLRRLTFGAGAVESHIDYHFSMIRPYQTIMQCLKESLPSASNMIHDFEPSFSYSLFCYLLWFFNNIKEYIINHLIFCLMVQFESYIYRQCKGICQIKLLNSMFSSIAISFTNYTCQQVTCSFLDSK